MSNPSGQDIVAKAREQIGKPYKWGAKGPDAFDCSGLIQWTFAQFGIEVGGDTAAQQTQFGRPVAPGDERPGDAVYLGDLAGEHAHGGIVESPDHMIDAPHTGANVREDSISGWAASGEALRGYRRFLPIASTTPGPRTVTDEQELLLL